MARGWLLISRLPRQGPAIDVRTFAGIIGKSSARQTGSGVVLRCFHFSSPNLPHGTAGTRACDWPAFFAQQYRRQSAIAKPHAPGRQLFQAISQFAVALRFSRPIAMRRSSQSHQPAGVPLAHLVLLKWRDRTRITVPDYPPPSPMAPRTSTGPAISAHSANAPRLFSYR
jgi:hypothetical protein